MGPYFTQKSRPCQKTASYIYICIYVNVYVTCHVSANSLMLPWELAAKSVFDRGLQATAERNSDESSSRREEESEVIERTTLKRYRIRGRWRAEFGFSFWKL